MGQPAQNLVIRMESPGPCYKCGVSWMMPDYLLKKRREDGGEFFCPNGHGQMFTKSQADILREQLDRQRRETEWARQARDRAQRQAKLARRSAAAQKGHVTRNQEPREERSLSVLQSVVRKPGPPHEDQAP